MRIVALPGKCRTKIGREIAHAGRGAADCGEYRQAAGANSTNARSVITPLNPRRRMRSRRRHVLRIRLAIAAEPSRGFHALLKAREAAICPAAIRSTVIQRAPRIVLSLGARSNADDTDANSQHEQ